jgi:hypothetical protein
MNELVSTMTAELVSELGPKVRSSVSSAVRKSVLAASPAEVMTFVTPGGTRYAPEVSVDYVKALWSFVRGQDFDGRPLDSALTKPITAAVEGAIVIELNSDDARSIVSRAVTKSTEVNTDVRSTFAGGAELLAEQIGNYVGMFSGSAVADQVANAATGSAADILNTTSGKMIVAGIVQVAGSASGKALISALVKSSAAKVAGATLLKAGVAAGLKKIGLVILIKAVIMKVLAVLLPGVVLAKIPIFWVLLPIIGAFIAHELSSMPKKLAEKLPGPVSEQVGGNFAEIAKSFSEMVLADLVTEVARARPKPNR